LNLLATIAYEAVDCLEDRSRGGKAVDMDAMLSIFCVPATLR